MKLIVPFSRAITPGVDGRGERLGRDADALQERLRRRPGRRRERERARASPPGGPEIRPRTSSSNVSGTGSGPRRVDLAAEGPGNLECIEWVAARLLVDA